jgi:hypothetical protein
LPVRYIVFEAEESSMEGDIEDPDRAIEIAKDYAADDCLGELGEVVDASKENSGWIVEFRTHTFADTYEHRVLLSRIGNVFSYDCSP